MNYPYVMGPGRGDHRLPEIEGLANGLIERLGLAQDSLSDVLVRCKPPDRLASTIAPADPPFRSA